jgi:hypothetical protein
MREEGVIDKEFQFFENEEQFMNKAANTHTLLAFWIRPKQEKAGIGMKPKEEATLESMQKMVKRTSV